MFQDVKNIYHLLVATAANSFYLFPSRKLFVIGVTGTDGKTTTSSLIYHILKTAGLDVALVNTVGASIGDKNYDTGFHTTTPSSIALQKYISAAVKSNNKYLILEVTSHALDQNRAAFIPFKIGVLTNVTHEHLDYHKTYENYVSAKAKLLLRSSVSIINKDDQSYDLLKGKLKDKKVITYGLDKNADMNPHVFPFKTKLVGEFNRYNILSAIAVAQQLGINEDIIRTAILSYTPPIGRQEVIYDKEFKVMVDFAHTPNAFARLLPALKETTKGRLIHVFGSAGERDHNKRPLMGKEASRYDDIIILTTEDSRSEKVSKINEEIMKDIPKGQFESVRIDTNIQVKKNKKYIFEIPDRAEAIAYAVSLAQKGDYIVMTGKGHEKSMNVGHGEQPWDEVATVKNALKNKGYTV